MSHYQTRLVSTFLTTLLLFVVLLAVLGTPLWLVAARLGRTRTIRNFAIGAVGVALAAALMAYVSERQMAQCEAAGNPSCFDYGTTGFQILMVLVYVTTAWWSAYSIWRG